MRLLNESTRDNMLLPYVEMLQQKGIETNLGKLKGDLLKLLADGAGIHNLSLRSNFYLAGCARYYFNGGLTVDGNVGLLTGQPDNFNEEICQRLNALIVILRNAYVDSVGTQFEQPEDFGTLKLPALLKKYNSKINAELGIITKQKEKVEKVEEPDNLDRNPVVGQGYSFDIIYNFSLGRNYERPTAPGSWCVTYHEGHFNNYTKRSMPPSHLVVFRMDGWENIDRTNGKDTSKWVRDGYNRNGSPRPHDPYANSLIAFFQSNDSWEPANYGGAPLITSRWNHGANDTGNLEADRAYSLQEFMKITGVSERELQRIYEIWKKDKKKFGEEKKERNKLSPEEKKARVDFLRMLKTAQMYANGGDSLTNNIQGLEIVSTFVGNGSKLTKGVFDCKVGNNHFLIDKGQIVFDSIVYEKEESPYIYICKDSNTPFMNFAIIIQFDEKVYSVYNFRTHSIVDVDGLDKFCSASIRQRYSWGENDARIGEGPEPAAMLFRQRGNRSVLFSSRTGLPIKLPNGQYIFEKCSFEGSSWGVTENDGYIKKGNLLFIIFDSSSRETYMFNPTTEQFNVFDKRNWEGVNNLMYVGLRRFWSRGNKQNSFEELTIEYKESEWEPRKYRYILFNKENGQQMNIFPGDQPYSTTCCANVIGNYLFLQYDSKGLRKLGIPRVGDKPFLLYNYVEKDFLRNETTGKPMQFDNWVLPAKYPNATLIIVGGTYSWRSSEENPYIINLDNKKIYPIPVPLGMMVYTNRPEKYTEEWFCCRVRTQGSTRYNNILDSRNFAHVKDFIFYRYEDVLNGQKTTPEDINVEEVFNEYTDNGTRMYESMKITKDDIVEMVKKICNRLLENQ